MVEQRLSDKRSLAQASRCLCGNLLARLGPDGVELKCRRCKRVVLISWETPTTWHGVEIEWQKEKQGSEEVK